MVGPSTIGCDRRQGGHAAGHPRAGTESGARRQHWKIFSGVATAREGCALQIRRMEDDDLGAEFGRREITKVSSAGAGADFVPKIVHARKNTKVAIYHGTTPTWCA